MDKFGLLNALYDPVVLSTIDKITDKAETWVGGIIIIGGMIGIAAAAIKRHLMGVVIAVIVTVIGVVFASKGFLEGTKNSVQGEIGNGIELVAYHLWDNISSLAHFIPHLL